VQDFVVKEPIDKQSAGASSRPLAMPERPALPSSQELPEKREFTQKDAADYLNSPDIRTMLVLSNSNGERQILPIAPTVIRLEAETRVPEAIRAVLGLPEGTKIELPGYPTTDTTRGAFSRTNEEPAYLRASATSASGETLSLFVAYPISLLNLGYSLDNERLGPNDNDRRDAIIAGSTRDMPTNLRHPKAQEKIRAQSSALSEALTEIAYQLCLPEGYSISLDEKPSKRIFTINENVTITGKLYRDDGKHTEVGKFELDLYSNGDEVVRMARNKGERIDIKNPLSADEGRLAQIEKIRAFLEKGSSPKE
jgi:hypothetical protein